MIRKDGISYFQIKTVPLYGQFITTALLLVFIILPAGCAGPSTTLSGLPAGIPDVAILAPHQDRLQVPEQTGPSLENSLRSQQKTTPTPAHAGDHTDRGAAANAPVIRGQQPDGTAREPAVNPNVVLAQAEQPSTPNRDGLELRDRMSDDSVDKVIPLWDPHAPLNVVPFDIHVEEARTGRLYFGGGYNSDLGVTGNIMIDERNFDYRRLPRSVDDLIGGDAFRGGGQGFRLELVPGEVFQRYTMMFTEPYWRGTNMSMNVNAFYLDRRYLDWDEQRTGGRISWGYRLTHDLSVSAALRAENIEVLRPRIRGVEDLESALGDTDLFSGRLILSHDTRDVPFLPTEGHFFEMSYEQVFGSYDYPRGEVDFRKYFLMKERADGSGRHTLSYGLRLGITGSQTPIFENYFAGGFSTMRGFDFRGAAPKDQGVVVGGELRFLGSVEYMVPLTADDMLRGVFFTDFGTVEEQLSIHSEDFRAVVGFGLRVSVPMMGPAPLALDLAFPLAREDTDDIRNFSFFFGFGRL